jgi:SAM-dependent methyltransferase
MIISEHTINTDSLKPAEDNEEFGFIRELAGGIAAKHVLAINPRNGDYLGELIKQNPNIDSFVSDDEWVDAAKQFSRAVYPGYSHRPLLQLADDVYDLVLVCEDMGFVDDCDAMFQQYYRLLRPEGVLIGGLWNISYADSIDRLLCGKGAVSCNELRGSSAIPLDCLMTRLSELGFSSATIHRLPGDRKDIKDYAAVSSRNANPVAQIVFNTKLNFIHACK